MIEADGVAIGYSHAIDATLWGDDLPDDLEPGTWDLDLFIASAEHRGRGLGVAALEILKTEVFSMTLADGCVRVRIDPQQTVVRAYEKAGFDGSGSGTTARPGQAGSWWRGVRYPTKIINGPATGAA